MADIFLQRDAQQLLNGKTIYFIGDSNMRGVYKDLVQLSGRNCLLGSAALRSRLEKSFNGDELVFHGPKCNGRNFREERVYQEDGFVAKFFFITQCYNDYVESIFNQMEFWPPDVIIYNSCLWDLSRWGPQGVDKYKDNMEKLLKRLKEILHPSCLFIWTTTPPLSQQIQGGFLIPQVEFLKHTLRFDVMEANSFTSKIVSESGYDVLDVHYHVRWQIHRRALDGIHWLPHVVRHITNLILTHVCLAWNEPLPKHFDSTMLMHVINMCGETGDVDAKCIDLGSERELAKDEKFNLNFDQNYRMNLRRDRFDTRQNYRNHFNHFQQENQFGYQSQPIVRLQDQNLNYNNTHSSYSIGHPQLSNPFRFGATENQNFGRGFPTGHFPPPPLNGRRCLLPMPDFRNYGDSDTRRTFIPQPHNGYNECSNPFDVVSDPRSNCEKFVQLANQRKQVRTRWRKLNRFN